MPHAPLPVSDDFSRPRHGQGATARISPDDELCGRLSRIADTLRQASGRTAQPPAIDRLLHAIGEQSGYLPKNAKGQAGEVAVAIDSIVRWIGNAENRFLSLAETGIRDQRRMEHIVSLAVTQEQAMHKQAVTVRAMIGKAEQAISSLERKLDHIENRIAEKRPDDLNEQIATLNRRLDLHFRLTTRKTASSTRYFELMTRQIEAFAWELRQLRSEAGETKRKAALLPQLMEQLGQLTEQRKPASETRPMPDEGKREAPALAAMTEKLDQAITRLENEADATRTSRQAIQTDMDTLRQRIRQLEELSHSLTSGKIHAPSPAQPSPAPAHAPLADSPDMSGDTAHIRGGFIAAARQAARNGQGFQQDESGSRAGTSRFLRAAGSGGV